jgi:hypothetical protein
VENYGSKHACCQASNHNPKKLQCCAWIFHGQTSFVYQKSTNPTIAIIIIMAKKLSEVPCLGASASEKIKCPANKKKMTTQVRLNDLLFILFPGALDDLNLSRLLRRINGRDFQVRNESALVMLIHEIHGALLLHRHADQVKRSAIGNEFFRPCGAWRAWVDVNPAMK